MTAAALLWCPFPDEHTARAAVTALRGEESEARECGVLLKTGAALRDRAMRRLAQLHPYGTPAIPGWAAEADAGTLAWPEDETRRA